MQRRKAIGILLGTAALPLPLLLRHVVAPFRKVHAELPATPALKTLNPHQDATVTVMAELIIPQTETPGAKAVRVNEFIDLILTDWFDEEARAKFLSGLAHVDTRSRGLFGKHFIDCSAVQQKQLLTAYDEELAETRQADIYSSHRRRRGLLSDSDFFYTVKRLTLVGYFTSEEGATKALHYEVIPAKYLQCAPLEETDAAKTNAG